MVKYSERDRSEAGCKLPRFRLVSPRLPARAGVSSHGEEGSLRCDPSSLRVL